METRTLSVLGHGNSNFVSPWAWKLELCQSLGMETRTLSVLRAWKLELCQSFGHGNSNFELCQSSGMETRTLSVFGHGNSNFVSLWAWKLELCQSLGMETRTLSVFCFVFFVQVKKKTTNFRLWLIQKHPNNKKQTLFLSFLWLLLLMFEFLSVLFLDEQLSWSRNILTIVTHSKAPKQQKTLFFLHFAFLLFCFVWRKAVKNTQNRRVFFLSFLFWFFFFGCFCRNVVWKGRRRRVSRADFKREGGIEHRLLLLAESTNNVINRTLMIENSDRKAKKELVIAETREEFFFAFWQNQKQKHKKKNKDHNTRCLSCPVWSHSHPAFTSSVQVKDLWNVQLDSTHKPMASELRFSVLRPFWRRRVLITVSKKE